jgi:hypothetical protein
MQKLMLEMKRSMRRADNAHAYTAMQTNRALESEQQRSERSLQQRALQVWSTTVKAMQHNVSIR